MIYIQKINDTERIFEVTVNLEKMKLLLEKLNKVNDNHEELKSLIQSIIDKKDHCIKKFIEYGKYVSEIFSLDNQIKYLNQIIDNTPNYKYAEKIDLLLKLGSLYQKRKTIYIDPIKEKEYYDLASSLISYNIKEVNDNIKAKKLGN